MIEFRCRNCGENKKKNVLPGRHAINGSIAELNRTSGCCKNTDYADNCGLKEESMDKGLRELVAGFRA